MAESIIAIPMTFTAVIFSLNTITPVIVAINGSIVARIEAFPASVPESPFV